VVTVVVPTRDREDLVGDAVACALGQEGVPLEVIVVDDGSRDGTAALLARIGDPRLRVVRHERSAGVARARNAAAALARGRWVAFLDDDDLWAPDWLATASAAGEAAGAGFVYGGFMVIDRDRGVIRAQLPERPGVLRQRLRRDNAVGTPSCVLVDAAVLRAAVGFDPRFQALADWELWIRLERATASTAVPELLVAWTEHAGNMHIRNPGAVDDEHALLAAEQGGDRIAFARWLASENLRYGGHRHAARFYLEAARRSRQPGDLVRAVTVRSNAARLVAAPPRQGPPWLTRWQGAGP
jgi:glycosyltransferase involved in cell wall biosynthesis